MLLCPANVLAQDEPAQGPIQIEHVPAGIRIVVDGTKYIAYDLPRLKLLAAFDAEHAQLVRKFGLLGEKLKIKEEMVSELSKTIDMCQSTVDKLKQDKGVLVEPDPKDSSWHINHIVFEIILAAVIGGLIYVLAK
jgi:hypothetical protein